MVAFAASNNANASADMAAAEQMKNFSSKHGLQALSDDDMSDVSAQGITEDIAAIMGSVKGESDPDAVKVLKTMTNVFLPTSNMIAYDSTVEGVSYDTSKPVFQVRQDGKMELAMPTHIDKISLENLRVKGGNPSGPTFGSIYISDISFDPSSKVVISVH